jgi:hypothetical protein
LKIEQSDWQPTQLVYGHPEWIITCRSHASKIRLNKYAGEHVVDCAANIWEHQADKKLCWTTTSLFLIEK